MNPDGIDVAGQQEAAAPPVNTPPTPTRTEVVEDQQQLFKRVLGYLYIEEAFIIQVLILTEEQRSNVLNKAKDNEDEGFTYDALSFLKLLDAADHYAKLQGISVLDIQWRAFTEDSTTLMVSVFVESLKARSEELERSKNEATIQAAANASEFPGGRDSFPPTTDTIDFMGNMSSGGSAFVKKSLKTFENSKFPSVPVTVRAMKEFRINMKNQMRSMDLDHLVNDSYQPPNEGDPGYEKYRIDNKFFFSAVVEILSNPNHPARSWLMTEELENDGRAAYYKLISHYDNETIEDSFVQTAYVRWINTKLTGVHLGAMKTYITKYQTVLSEARETGTPVPDNAAKEIFLTHIKPDNYQQVVMNCKIDKLSLSDCMDRCLRVAVSVEAGAASRARRAARVTQDNEETTSTTSTSSNYSGGKPRKYNGKEINEYGYFKDRKYWSTLTQDEKNKFYKQLDKWVLDGVVKRKEKGGGSSTNKKAVIKEVIAALKSEDAPTPSNDESNDEEGESYDDRVLKFLNTKINVARRVRFGIGSATVRSALQSSPSNAIIDSGADTCL